MPLGDGYGGEGVHITPAREHTSTLVFMHGLGDTAHGWADVWNDIATHMPAFSKTKVILPTATVRRITMNGGFPMPGWSDLEGVEETDAEDETGLMESRQRIHNIINGEISKGIPASKIVVGGFSQGGALAYLSGLTFPATLGGIVGLSCWLPLYKSKPQLYSDIVEQHPAIKHIPIQHCHGQSDPLVKFRFGASSIELLKTLGFANTHFSSYPGLGHSSSDQEISDVCSFLEKIISDTN